MYNFAEMPTQIIKPELQICKNDLNRTIIGNLTEAYQINQKIWVGNINELTFLLPYFIVTTGHQLKRNKNIDKIKNRRIIKFKKGNYTEYYIIQKISDVAEDTNDYKKVECYSLGYELSGKIIKNYSVVSYNAQQALNDVLNESVWSTDYIDSEFLIKYRAFDISAATVLDAIQQIAIAFDAVIIYDTVNRKINFYKLDNIGVNKGLTVKYGKLLKNITYETNSDDYCTRLKAYGKDGLVFSGINATGTNYVESYASILAGFQRDENGNVLSHAADISDSLAIALLDYTKLVESKQGVFKGYLTSKTTYQTQLTGANNTLNDLNNELATIEDSLSVANAEGTSTSLLITQKNAKLAQINDQQTVINGIKTSISNVDAQIDTLVDLLDLSNNFTSDQLYEWNLHVVVKEWSNDYYTDAQSLYDATVEEFNKRQEPKLVVNISIVNLLEVLTEYKNHGKLNIGDIITIEHEILGINVSAKIMQMDFDYENGDVSLTISNVREILNDEERFIRDMYKSITSSATYSNDKHKYDDAYVKSSEIYQDIQGTWNANKREIIASNNESVEISRKGIRIYDLNDPNKLLIAQHGILAISADGGNNWKTAIRYDGIVAEQIKGVMGEFVSLYADRIIVNPHNNAKIPDSVITSATYWNSVEGTTKTYAQNQANAALSAANIYSDNNLITANTYSNNINTAIRNDLRLQAPLPTSLRLDGSGVTAYTSDTNKFARLDYRGLYVQNGAIQITSTDGTTVIDGEGVTAAKIKAGDMYGVNLNIGSGNQIFKANGSGISLGHAVFGSAPFRVDMNGNLWSTAANISGAINCTSLSINGTSILAGNQINGNYVNQIRTDQLVAGNAKISTALIDNLIVGNNVTMGANASLSWTTQITNKPFIPSSAGDVGAVAANQNAVFNTLTNYGALRGLFMQGGELYINADYINAGYIRADRITGNSFTAMNTIGIGSSGDTSSVKKLVFNDSANISTVGGTALQYNAQYHWFNNRVFMENINVSFSGSNVTGLTVKFI